MHQVKSDFLLSKLWALYNKHFYERDWEGYEVHVDPGVANRNPAIPDNKGI